MTLYVTHFSDVLQVNFWGPALHNSRCAATRPPNNSQASICRQRDATLLPRLPSLVPDPQLFTFRPASSAYSRGHEDKGDAWVAVAGGGGGGGGMVLVAAVR